MPRLLLCLDGKGPNFIAARRRVFPNTKVEKSIPTARIGGSEMRYHTPITFPAPEVTPKIKPLVLACTSTASIAIELLDCH